MSSTPRTDKAEQEHRQWWGLQPPEAPNPFVEMRRLELDLARATEERDDARTEVTRLRQLLFSCRDALRGEADRLDHEV